MLPPDTLYRAVLEMQCVSAPKSAQDPENSNTLALQEEVIRILNLCSGCFIPALTLHFFAVI